MQKLRWALKALPVVLFALCSATWAEPAKPDSAEAAAAMERAQRIASNPMRVILQASKFRRKAAEAPEPVDDSALRRTAARVVSVPEAAPQATPPPAEFAQAAAPAVPATAPPASRSLPTPAPLARMASATLSSDSGLARPGESVAALQAGAVADGLANLPGAAAPLAAPTGAFLRPKLVEVIEPAIPPRLLADGTAVKEVLADLTIRTDGSVAAVALVSSVPRQWQRYVVAAFERWRFEPLAAHQVHRVQLVFNDQ